MPDNQEKKPAVQDPQINEKLLKTRSIMLSGEINKESAELAIKQLLVLEGESNDPVRIFINSPGGDVDAGYAIFDMARFVSCPVTMIGMGLVASAAALVLLAVPAERRLALPNSTYLIHQPMSGMKGVATDIEIHALHLENFAKLDALIAKETGKTIEEFPGTRSVTTGYRVLKRFPMAGKQDCYNKGASSNTLWARQDT